MAPSVPCPAHSCGAGDLPLLCRCGPGTAPPALVGRLLTGRKIPEVRSCSMPSGVTHFFTCLCLYGMRSGIKEIRRMRTSIQKCHRGGTTILNNSFSAPSCSLLCQCRIELWNYSHETYFFLFFPYIPSLLLLGISNNLYKYLQFCLENHGQMRLVVCRSWKRSYSTCCVQGSGCKVWAERRGRVEPVTWLW